MTSTSTTKDIQSNTKLQLQQKSTIKPDKQLTSNLLRYKNKALTDDIDIYDPEEDELKLGNWLPPSVNQRTRKKDQYPLQSYYNPKYPNVNSLTDNSEQQNTYWEKNT